MKILSIITHPVLLQTRNNFVHLWNTNEDILDEIRPFLDSNATDRFKAQKGSKDIIKIVNLTSVVLP